MQSSRAQGATGKGHETGSTGLQMRCGPHMHHARGPVSSEVPLRSIVAHETLQLQTRADLTLRRFEYDQGVDEKPAPEWRKGELVPDDLGQENGEVEAVPARQEQMRS